MSDTRTLKQRLHAKEGINIAFATLNMTEAELADRLSQDTYDLVHVDAADRFIDLLAGVTDPEEKRKIIGEGFVEICEQEAARLGIENHRVAMAERAAAAVLAA